MKTGGKAEQESPGETLAGYLLILEYGRPESTGSCAPAGPGGEQSTGLSLCWLIVLNITLLLPAPFHILSLIRRALPPSHCFPSVGINTLLGPMWDFRLRSVETQRPLHHVSL